MASPKILFLCRECGGEHPKWGGQCQHCGAWNTLEESMPTARSPGARTRSKAQPTVLREISTEQMPRITTGSAELDRVLGSFPDPWC